MGFNALKVALVAGEASGDRQGAALIRALQLRAAPRPVAAWGIGGALMREAGVDIRHDCATWAGIGIVATAPSIPHFLSVLSKIKRALAVDPPDVLVLIDAGGFNIRLASWVKRKQICPVFYYFPPGSWRRTARPPKGRLHLAEVTDRIVTPFPWSAEFLSKEGADAHFVGHPLLDLVHPILDDDDFYKRFGLDPKRALVALMPGSRIMEVKHILPAMIGAAGEISRRVAGVQFAVVLATTVPRSYVEGVLRREQKAGGRAVRLQLLINQAGDKLAQIAQSTLTVPVVPHLATSEGITIPATSDQETSANRERASTPTYAPLVICEDVNYDVMARSDLVITKAGTSTLEAAILKKPMIIVYRGNTLMAAEWKLRKRSLNIQYIGSPNILAQEEIFPELLQDDANPEAISEIAVGILLQPERLLAMKQRISEVIQQTLGEPGGVGRAADLLYETATRNGT